MKTIAEIKAECPAPDFDEWLRQRSQHAPEAAEAANVVSVEQFKMKRLLHEATQALRAHQQQAEAMGDDKVSVAKALDLIVDVMSPIIDDMARKIDQLEKRAKLSEQRETALEQRAARAEERLARAESPLSTMSAGPHSSAGKTH